MQKINKKILTISVTLIIILVFSSCASKKNEKAKESMQATVTLQETTKEVVKTNESIVETTQSTEVETSSGADEMENKYIDINISKNNDKNKNVIIENVDISDIENNYTYQQISYPKITIKNNDVLQKSLDELNKQCKTYAEQFKERNKNEIRKFIKDSGVKEAMYSLDTETSICRNDEKYLSMQMIVNEFLMGAHGSHYFAGHTYDAKTGKKIKLDDVITNREDLKKYLLEWAKKTNKNNTFFPEYEQTIVDYCNGDYELQFLLQDDKVFVIFQHYDIAPYAYGPSFVPLDPTITKIK